MAYKKLIDSILIHLLLLFLLGSLSLPTLSAQSETESISPDPSDSAYHDIAILVAFPDMEIRIPTRRGLTNKVSTVLDFNEDEMLPVGHAGIVIIEGSSGHTFYFDFGRYQQREDSLGHRPAETGVVRSCFTVEGLELPTASIVDGKLLNAFEIVSALDTLMIFSHYGRITASVYYGLSFERMIGYARSIEQEGYLPYGAPFRQYCSRYAREVAEAGGANFSFIAFTGQQNVNQTLSRNPGQDMIEIK